MTTYVLFYNKENGGGEIGTFNTVGTYQSMSTGQFLKGKDGWDIIQSTAALIQSEGASSRSLAYYNRSNGRLDFGGLDFSQTAPKHVTTKNEKIDVGWDFIFPFEQINEIPCELYIKKSGQGLVMPKNSKNIVLNFSPWTDIVELGQRFFFYNQSNGHTALGNLTGKFNASGGAFGFTEVTGFASVALTNLPIGYDIVVTTDHFVLLYNSQTGKYNVGLIESDQWQPMKSGRELFTGSPAKEKTTEAGFTHITHLANDDLLFYNAKSSQAFVANIGRRPFSINNPIHNKPMTDVDLLQIKQTYEPSTFSKNWSHIVSFQVDFQIIH